MKEHEYKINVSEWDIQTSVRGTYAYCMVSTAIERAIGGAKRIEVYADTIRISLKGKRLIYFTPDEIRQYIKDFDAGKPIAPFVFVLSNPAVKLPKLRTAARAPLRGLSDKKSAQAAPTKTRCYGARALIVNRSRYASVRDEAARDVISARKAAAT